MNSILKFSLKASKRAISIISRKKPIQRSWKTLQNKSYSNDLIYRHLIKDEPCMVGRFGATEMLCLMNYLGVKYQNTSWINYIRGRSQKWWWEPSTINQMQMWSGFFPAEVDKVERFCELMLRDISEVDILGSWLEEEEYFKEELKGVKRVVLEDLEPFFTPKPWTRALKGKKVLVIHPFADTIKQQFQRRDLLFENNLLPEFELITLKAVQSIAGENSKYSDWFEALDSMTRQMDQIDYEICIIGCGAYGFPLAAHAKRMKKKAIHLGGVTQLLFGIIGNRWENSSVWPYRDLFNQYWVRPSQHERPKEASVVEGACYW